MLGRRHGSAITVALVATLAAASAAVALTWDGPAQSLAEGGEWPESEVQDIAATGPTSAIVAYRLDPSFYDEQTPDVIWARRTRDSGATWSAPVRISSPRGAGSAALDALGSTVHATWTGADGRVMYRRSGNAGRTWTTPVVLSGSIPGWDPDIAAGTSGQVTVAWLAAGPVLRMRTSPDGGLTWRGLRRIDLPEQPRSGSPTLAIAASVTYLAYHSTDSRIRLRRSLDAGVTWVPGITVANDSAGYDLAIEAAGHIALVGFTRIRPDMNQVVVRRSTDHGAAFGTAKVISHVMPSDGSGPEGPTLTHRSGHWVAVYNYSYDRTYVRVSTDGAASWSPPRGTGISGLGSLGGVGTFAGRYIVAYTNFGGLDEIRHAVVRTAH